MTESGHSALEGVIEKLRTGEKLPNAAISEIGRVLALLTERGWSGFITADDALRAELGDDAALDDYVNGSISATIAACAWLIQRGEPVYATKMRNQFMKDWGVEKEGWNGGLDTMVEYARRKGGSVDGFEALRLDA